MGIALNKMSVALGGKQVLDALSFSFERSCSLAVIGPTGSGKTTLLKALAGQLFSQGSYKYTPIMNKTVFVDQQHRFTTKQNTREFYYQQRFNSTDSTATITVAELLAGDTKHLHKWRDQFGIASSMHKPLIQLSNGESKRVQLIQALLSQPDLLVMDHPFAGLDKEGRKELTSQLECVNHEGIDIIMSCDPSDIPGFIDNSIVIDQGKLIFSGSTTEAIAAYQSFLSTKVIPQNILPYRCRELSVATFIEMHNVSVVYANRHVLKGIHWNLEKGEKWCIKGKNGSGKTTLLNLITADHPQAYSNHVSLFGKKRGSGESIWDIKKNIGYVSPELHLHFDRSATVYETIASGLYDTIGLFKKPSPDEQATVLEWISAMGLERYIDCPLFQLSLGTQRLVMLTRAFVKSPPLLILDEPCQGLDALQTKKIRDMLDSISQIIELSMVYVSHYEEDIPSCITHFLTLENGCIVSES